MTGKILVFGALGRVGSAVIKALPETAQIVAADLDFAKASFPPNVETRVFDFNHPPRDLSPLFAGVARMFILWPPGVDVKKAMQPVIRAAAQAGVRQAVYLSILGADRLKIVPHRTVEKLLEASGMNWVFVRSAYFMQNLSGIHAPEIKNQAEIYIPAGGVTLGLVDVRDVAAVIAKSLVEDHQNRAYSLTGGQALTFEQVAREFADVLQRPVRYGNPSAICFWRHMRQRGIPAGLVAFMLIEYAATKLGKSGHVTTQVGDLLGRPPISLRQFVQDHAYIWQ